MKKSKYIKLVIVSGIVAACSSPSKDPSAALYNRLHVRTDTSGLYTYGEPGYELYPYGDIDDNQSYSYFNPFYYRIGYGSSMLSPHSSIEATHISRGGFGSSAFHVST